MKNVDLVIVGGGSAGLAAALQAKEEGIQDILILEKENCLGGILQQCIHNGFGLHRFKEQLSGPEYAQRYIDEINEKKIPYKLNTSVYEINQDKEIFYTNEKEGCVKIQAKAIIMATGCSERSAGAIQLEGARISGILSAGLAQKYMNIDGYMVGKKVFILGSGDIGLIMARRCTLEGAKVLGVAEIMPYSNGLNRNIVQCLNDFNIPLYLSHTVKKVIGKNRVEKIILTQVDENLNYIENTEKEFECDTLILSVGLVPYNPLLEKLNIPLHYKTKGVEVDQDYQCCKEGIFSCGNALHVHDLVDFVSQEACMAAKGAVKYLKNQISTNSKEHLTIPANGISYVLPQKFKMDEKDTSIDFKFRVSKPFSSCFIEIKAGNQVIKKIKKLYLLPAEMEIISLDTKLFSSEFENLTFEIKED